LFDGLSPEDLKRLLESFEDLSLVAGQLLFRPGDLEPALYVVVEGAVEISLEVPGAQDALIATLEAGSVFGESSFFHPSPHHASAKCRTATKLIRLSRTVYDELLREGSLPASRLGTKAADILAARLQATDRWISQLLGEEQQAITMSWRRFREGLGGSFDLPHGFIHPY